MKTSNKNVILFLIFLLFLSVGFKKKEINSPSYPPSGQYFLVNGQRLDLLNSKSLIIHKIDFQGNIIVSKHVTKPFQVSGITYFRMTESWIEIQNMFSPGLNQFKFIYGNVITDHVNITATFKENNQIIYDEVLYNQIKIEPFSSEIPASNSKIYTVK